MVNPYKKIVISCSYMQQRHSSLVNWIKEEFTDISFNDNRLKNKKHFSMEDFLVDEVF